MSFFNRYGTSGEDDHTPSNDRTGFSGRTSEGRLHKYLKELRKRVPSLGGSSIAKGSNSRVSSGINLKKSSSEWKSYTNQAGKATEDGWKQRTHVSSTNANPKFVEKTPSTDKGTKSVVEEDRGYEWFAYIHGFDDVFRNEGLYEGGSDGIYGVPRPSPVNVQDENAEDSDDIPFVDVLDHVSIPSFRDESEVDESGYSDPDVSERYNTTQKVAQGKGKTELYDSEEFYEQLLCEGLSMHCPDTTFNNGHSEGDDYQGLVQSLRSIANQIELLLTSKRFQGQDPYKMYKALGTKLNSQKKEIVELRSELSKTTTVKRELTAKIDDLEKRMLSMKTTHSLGDVSVDADLKSTAEPGSSESLPPFFIDSCDLGYKAKTLVKRLKLDLYISKSRSLNPSFQAYFYQTLHEIPEVIHCKEIVHYINECIINDSEVLHTRLRQTALRQGVVRLLVEEHLSPFANRYPFPAEFEQRVIADLEVSQPMRRFNMSITKKRESPREPLGIVMNRIVLKSIFKYSHINNLYNYLFTALYWDNFRVVDILKDAIGAKFLDFQMAPALKASFRHPLMWAFGDATNPTQAYRYMKSLEFDFAQFPTDPNDGENLWHRIVKGDAVKVVQTLKAYMMYTEFLHKHDQKEKTPLEIANGSVLKELLTLVVVEMASKGSDLYKKNDFEGALVLYSHAIEKQIEALYKSKEDQEEISDVNLGKLYYNKARSLIHLDRWTEAVEACELCLKHIPDYTNAYVTCIQAYEKLLDWENAIKMCRLMGENCGVIDDDKMQTLQSQLGATMFQILGVPSSSSPRDIKRAFNKLCKQWHPDKVGAESAQIDIKKRSMNHFNRIHDAREKLLDDNMRLLEMERTETKYKSPEPILEPREKNGLNVDEPSSGRETSNTCPSKVSYKSKEDGTDDGNLLQTAVDRLQQQIDEMHNMM